MKCSPVRLALLCDHTHLTSLCSHLLRHLWFTGVNLLRPISHLFIHLILPRLATGLFLEQGDTPCLTAFAPAGHFFFHRILCTSPPPSTGPLPHTLHISPCVLFNGPTLIPLLKMMTSSFCTFALP